MKTTTCPKCNEKTKIYKIFAYKVFFAGFSDVNYWTSRGRADVVERVKENELYKYFEFVNDKPHDFHYSCDVNHCHIPKEYVQNPNKYNIF